MICIHGKPCDYYSWYCCCVCVLCVLKQYSMVKFSDSNYSACGYKVILTIDFMVEMCSFWSIKADICINCHQLQLAFPHRAYNLIWAPPKGNDVTNQPTLLLGQLMIIFAFLVKMSLLTYFNYKFTSCHIVKRGITILFSLFPWTLTVATVRGWTRKKKSRCSGFVSWNKVKQQVLETNDTDTTSMS